MSKTRRAFRGAFTTASVLGCLLLSDPSTLAQSNQCDARFMDALERIATSLEALEESSEAQRDFFLFLAVDSKVRGGSLERERIAQEVATARERLAKNRRERNKAREALSAPDLSERTYDAATDRIVGLDAHDAELVSLIELLEEKSMRLEQDEERWQTLYERIQERFLERGLDATARESGG